MLAGLAVSECGFFFLKAYLSALLGDQFCPVGIWVSRVVVQGQFLGAERNRIDPAPGCSLVSISWWLWARNRTGDLISSHRCVNIPGRPALSRSYSVWSIMPQDQLLAQTETGKNLSQAAPWFPSPEGSGWFPWSRSGGLLSPVIGYILFLFLSLWSYLSEFLIDQLIFYFHVDWLQEWFTF